MKKSKGLYMFLLILGVVLLLSGIVVQLFLDNGQYLGFSLGLGSAFIAIGMMKLIQLKVQKPEVLKQQQINENDERNIKIRERAAYVTFSITLYGMMAVDLVFVLLGYTIPSFVVTGMLLLHVCTFIFFMAHYSKKI